MAGVAWSEWWPVMWNLNWRTSAGILPAFRKLLKPGGAMLVTTPNAAALSKRLRLLFGQNPFEMLRETPENPGHFREYTALEMRKLGLDVSSRVVGC